jgi:hypothetical protein
VADKKKKKRDFISTFQSVERYHRRRSAFVIHAVLSLAFQVTVWANWYGSYAARGQGFEGTFFTDRISISVALLLFLAGHFVLMVLAEAKDRLVVRALEQHDEELNSYFDEDKDEPENELSADEIRSANESSPQRQLRR